jgi:hypothetical protein
MEDTLSTCGQIQKKIKNVKAVRSEYGYIKLHANEIFIVV